MWSAVKSIRLSNTAAKRSEIQAEQVINVNNPVLSFETDEGGK